MRGGLGRRRGLVTASRAALVLAVTLAGGPAGAQRPTAPAVGDLAIASGDVRHSVARLVDGRLVAVAPCLVAEGPLDAALEWRVASTGAVQATPPRQVQVGSEEWNLAAPRLLGLADRREREQRLATQATTRVPRFLDWLFVGQTGDGAVYYFETSRRVPSPPGDPDAADTDPPGTLRIAVSGFARLEAQGAAPLGTKGELRWEEDGRPRGPSRPDLRPLGIVTTTSGTAWVMEGRTPLTSTISIFSVGAGGTALVAATRIGRC